MAGYGNQANYEADLLQTYLRKGRVSSISRRDVDLALSIYKMPKLGQNYAEIKGKAVKGGAKAGTNLNYYTARNWARANEGGANQRSDASIMKASNRTVLAYAANKRKEEAKAKAAAQAAPRPAAPRPAPGPAPRPPGIPNPYSAPTPNYMGPLTPPSAPRPLPVIAPPRTPVRRSPFGGGARPL